ncbi:glycosyltransferase [Cohnella rhizosphaerae]|uniref:Glycosyltransferase n=1 Tax=Cohnella rhizosphaerae TaxID=1457232 RepID=A0A9X4KVT9_9BACL|nr:glycosyltransferase [Cohnella rhizosphaerae]MDG0811832.1 glycosyltransferase [Cohnella rhizosphaerae]
MAKYSVLISLYKKEKAEFLTQSINSMLNQTIMPDEIVIVKDGLLTEELDEVLKKYEIEFPNLFKFVMIERNVGLGLALNLGLKHCKNELIARMDTDDISKPDRCEKQLKAFLENKQLDIIGTMVDEFSEDPLKIKSSRIVPTNQKEIYEFSKKKERFQSSNSYV